MKKRNPVTDSFPVNFTRTFFVDDTVAKLELLIKGPRGRY
jgi:hypothetical protein